MCGIVGFGGRERIAPEQVVTMRNSMTHRGPDDHGLWTSADEVLHDQGLIICYRNRDEMLELIRWYFMLSMRTPVSILAPWIA